MTNIQSLNNVKIGDLYIDDDLKKTGWLNRLMTSLQLPNSEDPAVRGERFANRILQRYRENMSNEELRETGLSNFDLVRYESRHIGRFLHNGEHIKAAIYGKSIGKKPSGLLVATNLRIIYLHQTPIFTTMDELSYDLVSGVTYSTGMWWSSVKLHTRNGDYALDYVSHDACEKFVNYIEKVAIDKQLDAHSQSLDPYRLIGV